MAKGWVRVRGTELDVLVSEPNFFGRLFGDQPILTTMRGDEVVGKRVVELKAGEHISGVYPLDRGLVGYGNGVVKIDICSHLMPNYGRVVYYNVLTGCVVEQEAMV